MNHAVMAPAIRHPDFPIMTEEEFQEWRRHNFHREWDYHERDFDEDPHPFVPDKEAEKAWLEYWASLIQNRNLRHYGTEYVKFRMIESEDLPSSKPKSPQKKTKIARKGIKADKKEAVPEKIPRVPEQKRVDDRGHLDKKPCVDK